METHKERKEAEGRREAAAVGDSGSRAVERETRTKDLDPVAKVVINEAIVTDGGERHGHRKSGGAEKPDDVLAYSRAVHKVDSSLE